MTTSGSTISRAPRPSSLADVLDLILDKGLVIDAYVRVSAVGIELLTIDARIVIASVDTYLHYADAVNRLDLTQTETQGLTGVFGDEPSSDGRSPDGRSPDGRSSLASRDRPGQGHSQERGDRASSRSPARGKDGQEDGSEDGREEGRGRSLTRRLGEKGKWNS